MHILHVTPYYAPAYAFGGVVRAVEGMATAQVKAGTRVTVLTTDALTITDRVSSAESAMPDGVQVLRVRNVVQALRRLNLSTPFGFAEALKRIEEPIDVLHLHELRTVESLIVADHARTNNIPVVLSPHGTLNPRTGRSILKQRWDHLLSRRVMRVVRAVVALSEQEADDVRGLWSRLDLAPPRIDRIPNGVRLDDFAMLPDSSAFRQRYGIRAQYVVLFLGRLHERKGVETVLHAFQQAKLPDAELVFAGPDEGMRARLEAQSGKRVTFTGYLDADERLAALATASVFVLPAVGEGMSMAALEALAAGVPVILAPHCGPPEVAAVGAGLVVEPSIEAVTRALQTLLDPQKTNLIRMGEEAQALIAKQYTWSAINERLMALYRDVFDPQWR